MRLDKKFLARLLGMPETEIVSISGMTFQTANGPEGVEDFRGLLNDRHKRRVEALSAVLMKGDDLGNVVRAHIHMEHELHDFIFFAAPSPAHLKYFDKMEFSDRVALALVLGLDVALKAPLNATGNLRNKFAHRLDMTIGEEQAKNLIDTLSPSAKQLFQEHFKIGLLEIPKTPKLTGAALAFFRTRLQLIVFFQRLFEDVARERHRIAFEKLQSMAWH